jgi:hypothetical protein
MAFWSDASRGTPDPKRQFRWVVSVDTIPAFTLKKVSKPSFTVSESSHKFINHTYYYPGRVEWQEINMTLADPVNPDMAATVVSIINRAGYSPIINDTQRNTMSKSESVAALGANFQIQQLGSGGNPIETWTLTNPWIKDVKFGELDYEGDDLTDIELTIRYDWASIKTFGQTAPNAPSSQNEYWNLGSNSDPLV